MVAVFNGLTKLDTETVASFIDQYAATQVRELMLSANSQRTQAADSIPRT
jgi:hypothetical protein